MTLLRSPLTALFTVLVSVTALSLPAHADISIRVDTGRTFFQLGHSDEYRGVPVVRYVYPDGRVVERYGYDRGRREVLVLPSPVMIQQPVVIPQLSLGQQPRIQYPQTGEPRLLHGQRIEPLYALVVGTGHLAGREGPGTVYPELTAFLSGQTVVVTQVAGGGDGYDWFLAASGQGQHAWIRGDRLSFYQSLR